MRYLTGHSGFVLDVVFSPDNKRLVSGGSDHTWRVWDVLDGKPVGRPRKQGGWVTSFAFSEDGTWFGVAGHTKSIYLYEAGKIGRPKKTIAYGGVITGLAFSPDGRHLAWSSYDGTATLWDLAAQREVASLDHLNPKRSFNRLEKFGVMFSPDGRFLAVCGHNEWVQLWNVDKQKMVRELAHNDKAGCRKVAFTRDGNHLFGAVGEGVVIWDVKAGKLVETLADHEGVVSSLSLSRDGQLLASGSWDKTVCLYDVSSGENVSARLKNRLAWESGKIFSVALSPDGMLGAATSEDSSVVLWDID